MSGRDEVRDGSRRPVRDAAAPTVPRRAVMAALAAAGILGPVGFAVLAVGQALLRPGYSFLTHPIVALVEGPNGWVQDMNFVVLGSLMIAYAVGLHLGVAPTRSAVLGPALLVLSGIGPVWAGLATPIPAHFLITFLGAALGFIVMSRRMARDPKWHSLAGYALATGITILVVIPIHSLLALPSGAPLHPWWGLLNWSAVTLWLACTVVLAVRLLRVATAADAPRESAN